MKYVIQVTLNEDTTYKIYRRFSEVSYIVNGNIRLTDNAQFLSLQQCLRDPWHLPAKRPLKTALLPSSWVDDNLLEERKEGLELYLSFLLRDLEHREHPALNRFLSLGAFDIDPPLTSGEKAQSLQIPLEDNKTLISASYYPSWVLDTHPPEQIDFSKFDVLFFGVLKVIRYLHY